MVTKKQTAYRVGGAIVLLIVGAAIVVWAARSHLFRQPQRREEGQGQVLQRTGVLTMPKYARFSSEERRFLLTLARKTIEKAVAGGRLPEIDAAGLSSKMTEPTACFVTLTKQGLLRGCIGHIFPAEPLFRAVMDNARSAALNDTRFRPVQPDEIEQIELEISVLTVPRPLAFDSPEDLLRKLRPNEDGVVLRAGSRQATYLPQVWEKIPDKETFLAELSAKAGLHPLAWRSPGTSILTYQVEAFKESEM